MKTKLIINYWLILISWGLFLNDLVILAIVFSLIACTILLFSNWRINYWRSICIFLLSYLMIYLILKGSNIPYYFDKSYAFLATISLDMSITNEQLYLLTSKNIKPFLVVMILSLSVLSLITLILPDYQYSLFTKRSLYTMIAFIFLPYLISTTVCFAYKKIHNYNLKLVLKKSYIKNW